MTSATTRVSSAATPDLGEPKPGRNLVFAIVSIGLMMASVDQTIVATALPNLQHELHAQVNWSSWTITIYSLGQILVMPLAGRISDQYGRKKVYLGAVALFTTASLGCALANSIYLLVALRAIQAIGGGALMPSATGIVSDQFGRQRDRAVGLFSSIFPIGALIGPILGGVFVTYWSWRGIFLVNVPLGLTLIVLGLIFVPSGSRRPAHGLDLIGIALLGLTVLSGMFGVSFLGTGTTSVFSPAFLVPEVIAAIGLVGFVRHSARAADPFIPIGFLRGRGFGAMNLLNFVYGGAALGIGALVPLYASERYRIKILDAGTLLTARGIGMIATAAIAALLLRRTGYRRPLVLGLLVAAGGLVWMWVVPPAGVSPYLWLALSSAVMGLGMGISTPSANNATLQLAPGSAAAIAGLRGMFRQAGAITGLSITTAVVARSSDPGLAMSRIWLIYAAILAVALLLVRFVPEHRGSW